MLLVLAVHVKLPDAVDAELLFLELDFVGAGREFVGVGADEVGECGGEEDDLNFSCGELAVCELELTKLELDMSG